MWRPELGPGVPTLTKRSWLAVIRQESVAERPVALPPGIGLGRRVMLQHLSKDIRECYRCADECRQLAATARIATRHDPGRLSTSDAGRIDGLPPWLGALSSCLVQSRQRRVAMKYLSRVCLA